MAHSLSAKKRIRQNFKQRALNRSRRSAMRTKIKKVEDAIIHHNPEEAANHYAAAVRVLDREASRGLIHRNMAARKKSRLMVKINQLRREAAAKAGSA